MNPLLFSLLAVAPSVMNVAPEDSFAIRPWNEVTESTIEITVPSWTEELGFTVREKTEIQIGDLIRAVVKNPNTGEIMSESNEIEVEY